MVTAGVLVVPVKFNALNQLPVVNVGMLAPLVNDKFGALVAVPPVVPKVNVRATLIALVNPPVPVYVKLLASAMANAAVPVSAMLPEPNAIARTLVLLELRPLVVNVKLFKFSCPRDNVVVPVTVNASFNVATSAELEEIFSAAMVLPALVIVPLPTMFAVSPVYVPPVANIKELTLTVVVAGVLVVPVKFKVLNQLPLANVGTAAPLVNDKLGALVDAPPAALPKENVRVMSAAAVNPPVPEQVNPVAVAIDNTVVASVVCANTILPVPNWTERVLVLALLNAPVVNVKLFRFSVPLVSAVVAVNAVANAPASVVVPV